VPASVSVLLGLGVDAARLDHDDVGDDAGQGALRLLAHVGDTGAGAGRELGVLVGAAGVRGDEQAVLGGRVDLLRRPRVDGDREAERACRHALAALPRLAEVAGPVGAQAGVGRGAEGRLTGQCQQGAALGLGPADCAGDRRRQVARGVLPGGRQVVRAPDAAAADGREEPAALRVPGVVVDAAHVVLEAEAVDLGVVLVVDDEGTLAVGLRLARGAGDRRTAQRRRLAGGRGGGAVVVGAEGRQTGDGAGVEERVELLERLGSLAHHAEAVPVVGVGALEHRELAHGLADKLGLTRLLAGLAVLSQLLEVLLGAHLGPHLAQRVVDRLEPGGALSDWGGGGAGLRGPQLHHRQHACEDQRERCDDCQPPVPKGHGLTPELVPDELPETCDCLRGSRETARDGGGRSATPGRDEDVRTMKRPTPAPRHGIGRRTPSGPACMKES